MKVGFIGTGGTGKTTTVKLLEDLGLPYVKSTPRSVFAKYGITEAGQAKITPEQRWSIQHEMFDLKLELDAANPHGLFDRTIVDHLAYCYYRAADIIPDDVASVMEQTAQENMRSYSLVFYFPILPFDGNDGLRQQGWAYRASIDAIMLGFLNRFRVSYFTVQPGTPEERANMVRQACLGRSWLTSTQG